jgi:histone deacetylase 1/2
VNFAASTQDLVIPSSWFPDSGASHHITADAGNVAQGKPYLGSNKVHMGNGVGLQIQSIGSASFQANKPFSHTLHLKELLHDPEITKNLLSVSKFAADNHVFFEFHAVDCYVKSQVNNQVLLKGSLGKDGLYCFHHLPLLKGPTCLTNSTVLCSTSSATNKSSSNVASDIESVHSLESVLLPSNKVVASFVASSSSPNVWHHRLGHANSNSIKTILQLCKVSYNNTKFSDFCDSCCVGKSHRLHAPLTTTVYTTPFELIHTDLWGPAHTLSHCGYSYYIAFVDACTKYTWVYFLKQKSDALTAFTQFNSLVNTQFQTKIKSVQSDWGGEYRSISTLLTSLGINHRITCPHTSHQNGTVERRHRSIVETGLTLLSHAQLPLKFWDHSFTTAVHLLNRLPTSSLPQFSSPYHALHNKLPDYSSLRCFGCSCFPNLRPYQSHKLNFRSTKCVYLGPSPTHKGYKCLSPEGKVYISKDVVFNELEFPYSTLFSAPSSSTPPPSSPSWSSVIPTCPVCSASPNISHTSPNTDSCLMNSPSTTPHLLRVLITLLLHLSLYHLLLTLLPLSKLRLRNLSPMPLTLILWSLDVKPGI